MFKARFTKIKELSERRRLPRLGKIRLGVKMVSMKTKKEYPKETEFFVVPPEVAKVYGAKPTSLDVMVPINDPEVVFPQAYKWYGGQRGLKCIGDGEAALRLNEETREMHEIACPCERLDTGECQKMANFMVILPKINMGGVYQIDIGSYNSIVDINSGLDYVQALVGRFAMVPLRLCRAPKETHFGGQKQIHYTLQLFLDADADMLNALRENSSRVLLSTRNLALPLPEDTVEFGAIVNDDRELEKEEVGSVPPAPREKGIQSATRERTPVVAPEKRSSLPIQKSLVVSPARSNESKVKSPELKGDFEEPRITEQQIEAIKKIASGKAITLYPDALRKISFSDASRLVEAIQANDFDPEEVCGEFRELLS